VKRWRALEKAKDAVRKAIETKDPAAAATSEGATAARTGLPPDRSGKKLGGTAKERAEYIRGLKEVGASPAEINDLLWAKFGGAK
jgi:hypothetical protein